jgi:predicted nucleic acid-binding protein
MLTEASYVDSDVFNLPLLGERSSRSSGARRALEQIEAGTLTAYTSVLTWDEVARVVSKVLGRTDGLRAGRKLLNFPHLRFVDASASVIARAQAISEESGLAPRDAIHCATASGKGIRRFISDDRAIESIPEIERVPLESFAAEGGPPKSLD